MAADPSRRPDIPSVPPAARTARPAILLALAGLLLAGCAAGGQGTAGASSSPSMGSPASTTSPTDAPTPTMAPEATSTPVPSASPTTAPQTSASLPAGSSSPSATVAVLDSPFYGYTLPLPAGWSPQGAAQAWNGVSRIDSNGPYVDRATGPGSKLFFVYGAPSRLDLAPYAADGQQDVWAWHGCPAIAESETDVMIGGAPGRLHAFHCSGLYVMKAFVVQDGFGWAFNQLAPPGKEATDTATFEEMLADVDLAR